MEKIRKACMSKKTGKAEVIALLLYLAGILVISRFHERWFDEAQAWLIAKSASISDILFTIPHYEGHPPLWHLLLVPFAKSGADYELSLTLINTVFSALAMGIILFRAPFPKIIRCALPFTFFYFYQYGVNCRPYMICVAALLLAASFYHTRNTRPWRYVLLLMLLCVTSALGILMAGGLCLLWTWEILTELHKNGRLQRCLSDRRFLPLLCILILAILLLLELLPAENIYYGGQHYTVSEHLLGGIFFLAEMPFELWFGNSRRETSEVTITGNPAGCVVGILCWILLIWFVTKNHMLREYLFSHLPLMLFLCFFYSNIHHFGLIVTCDVFFFWILLTRNEPVEIPALWKRLPQSFDSVILKRFCAGVVGLLCCLPVFYSFTASYTEIKYNYCASFLVKWFQENDLLDKKIMAAWTFEYEEEKELVDLMQYPEYYMPSPHPKIVQHLPDVAGFPTMILPYLDSNPFMNYNVEYPGDLYMHYQYSEDPEAVLELWREQGLPDIIVGYCPLDEVYTAEELEGVIYVCILEYNVSRASKLEYNDEIYGYVYMRSDLLDEYPQFEMVFPYTPGVNRK